MKKISIIIPCFNEEFRFPVKEFLEFYASGEDINFLFVNDGSKDKTKELLDSIALGRSSIQVLHLKQNLGKAEAIRSGVLFLKEENQDYIGYLDADLATPLNQLSLMREILGNTSLKVVFGSRIKRAGATIIRSSFRHYTGRVIATIVNNLILSIPVYDTQCGAKMISTPIAKDIFKDPFISKWLFDVELLCRLQKRYNRKDLTEMVYEIPLTQWMEKGNSKIKFRDVVLIPFHLFNIYRKY